MSSPLGAARLAPHLRAQLAEAMTCHQRGDISTAERHYRSILAAEPRCVDAVHFLGLAVTQRGAVDEGLGLLHQAAAMAPAAIDIRVNLVRTLLGKRDPAAAIAACDAAIALNAAHAELWLLRGNACQLAELHEEAVLSFDHALRLSPALPAAANNRAHSLRMLRRPQEALRGLDQILALHPGYALALNNRGLALLDLQRAGEAVESFDRAIDAEPRFAEAISNRASALLALKRFTAAGQAFAQLMEIAPSWPGAAGSLVYARRNACDWQGLEAQESLVIAAVERGENADQPLSFLYTSDEPAALLACARAYVDRHYPPRPLPQPLSGPRTGDRVRVAYLSGDFGEHAVSYLLAGVIEHHDRARFDVIGVGWGRQQDGPTRQRLESAFDRFIDASLLSDLAVARLLRDLQVDLAVDLMGHTYGQRTGIFAHRAARRQAAFLGFPGTTGAPYMDYLIADAVVIPPGEEPAYAEQVVRLPACYLPADNRRAIAAPTLTRATAGLPAAGCVFCVFNNPAKFTRAVFHAWLRILDRVPGSVLWLRRTIPEVEANLHQEAIRSGVDPARLVYAEPLASNAAHLARYRLADLFLDTTPYNAHSTACDALWAGLPVLTCRGRSFAGRVGASLVTTLGMPGFIAESLADYEQTAVALATEPGRLAAARATLLERRESGPLFDSTAYTRHLEAAFDAMLLGTGAGNLTGAA